MRSFLSLILAIFSVAFVSAQDEEVQEQKTPQEIIDSTARAHLQIKFKTINDLIDSIHVYKDHIKSYQLDFKNSDLDSLGKVNLKAKIDSVKILLKRDDKAVTAKCEDYTKHRNSLKEYGNISQAVFDEFNDRNCKLYGSVAEEPIDYTKFIIIGDNAPIKATDLLDNENTKKVLADVFSIDSKTNLGTFEIPGDEEHINLYINKDVIEDSTKLEHFKNTEYKTEASDKLITVETAMDTTKFTYAEIPKKAVFKSIQIELLEGGIVDSRLILESIDGKTHFYFEGTDPVSLLNYSRRAPKRAVLKFSHYVSINGNVVYNEKALRNLRVKYTDVLDYHPNAGNNYVPDDVSYTFPSTENDKEKISKKRSYQVINNSHLQHVLDIRTYTDFIGLFGDEANGLFQVEGKADFFINPFNIPKSAVYYIKKVAPYVRYSRLDKDENFVEAMPSDTDPNLFDFNNDKLSILEKTNLEMGFNTNIFEFRIAKEVPFWISFYIPLSYHVTNVKLPTTVDDDFVNFKTFGVGFGTSIELKRLNNFGLNVGFEVKRYSNVGEYEKDNLIEPEKLETKAVNAEIFYYPNNNKSQSIFLRMRSIHDLSSNKEAFFQLQFGYRFTLGLGAVKAK